MPRYRITELSFINDTLVFPGSEIETDATPASHWEPLDLAEPAEPAEPAKTVTKAA